MIQHIVSKVGVSKGRVITIYGSNIRFRVNKLIDRLTPSLVIMDSPIYFSDKNDVLLLDVGDSFLSDCPHTALLISAATKIRYIFSQLLIDF